MHFLTFDWLVWMCGTVSVYWLVPASWRRYALVIVTAFFLLWYSPVSAALLTTFTFLTYFASVGTKMKGYRLGGAGVFIILVLAYFKATVSADLEDLLREVLIPLGLSYYSFRCVHYLLDQYRGSLPEHDFAGFLSYLFFIPTIVVGPIHRFGPFLRDQKEQRWSSSMISGGLERILYGYVKIAVLGNYFISMRLGQLVGSLEPASFLRGYLEIVRGGLSLYVQFSGFADVAIGFSLLLGYRVMENFNWPYLQKSIVELWRNWHISLTSWCRDYVYLPTLGLTRNPYLATVSSFLVIGLWHEASPRYLAWALYNAAWVLTWQWVQRFRRKLKIPRVKNRYGRLGLDALSTVFTIHIFWLGVAIVRQEDLTSALKLFRNVLFFWI